MTALLFFLTGCFFTKTVMPLGLKIMLRAGLKAKNYRGVDLPFPAGLIPILVFLLLTALAALEPNDTTRTVFWLCFGLVFLGLWDDLKGNHADKGLAGHLKALLAGRISTGCLKAAGGVLLSIGGAWSLGARETEHLIINTLLIALLTNFFNLLDLRPGRAIKVFLAAAVPAVWFLPADHYWLPALMGPVTAYFPWDLAAKGMLGDTGANILGFVLGLALVTLWGLPAKLVLLVALLGVQVYADRHSLTALIERHPLLRIVDRWGRPEY